MKSDKYKKFLGFGISADMCVNQNSKEVDSNLRKLCDGIIIIGNNAYVVNPRQNASDYYVSELVEFDAIEKVGGSFMSKSKDPTYLYDMEGKKYIIYNNNINANVDNIPNNNLDISLNGVVVTENNGDLLEIINTKIKICNKLSIKDMKDLNKILTQGNEFDNDRDKIRDYLYDKNIYTLSSFLYLGAFSDINSEYTDYAGRLVENPLFCRVGFMLELYPDFLLRSIGDIVGVGFVRSEVSNVNTSKYSNHNDRFVLVTLFAKFRTFFISISVDLKYIFNSIIMLLRGQNANYIHNFQFQEIKTIKFWVELIPFILDHLFSIIRTFDVGLELLNTLISVNCDIHNRLLGMSVRKNIYRVLQA